MRGASGICVCVYVWTEIDKNGMKYRGYQIERLKTKECCVNMDEDEYELLGRLSLYDWGIARAWEKGRRRGRVGAFSVDILGCRTSHPICIYDGYNAAHTVKPWILINVNGLSHVLCTVSKSHKIWLSYRRHSCCSTVSFSYVSIQFTFRPLFSRWLLYLTHTIIPSTINKLNVVVGPCFIA